MTTLHHIHLPIISLLVVTASLCAFFIIKKMRTKKEPKLLSEKKYNSTMIGKLEEIATAEVPYFNIWPYVSILKADKILSKKIKEKELVYKVYRNSTSEFEHILLFTEKENRFVVIVVDRNKKKIIGYSILDLKGEYDLVA
jgi:serine/threonine-protein kinase RIO1